VEPRFYLQCRLSRQRFKEIPSSHNEVSGKHPISSISPQNNRHSGNGIPSYGLVLCSADSPPRITVESPSAFHSSAVETASPQPSSRRQAHQSTLSARELSQGWQISVPMRERRRGILQPYSERVSCATAQCPIPSYWCQNRVRPVVQNPPIRNSPVPIYPCNSDATIKNGSSIDGGPLARERPLADWGK
jgi:hypothetical protein